jgi:Tfp pilus assembly protein PilF
MSLLMDALKKAELAKREGRNDGTVNASNQVAGSSSTADLALEPITSPIPTPASQNSITAQNNQSSDALPHLSTHLESLDDAFLAEMEATARRTPSVSAGVKSSASKPRTQSAIAQSASSTEPSAAQNLFTAKQAAPTAHNKNFAVLLGSLTALAVVAIGIYFWWQLQPHTTPPAAIMPSEAQLTHSVPPAPLAVLPAPTFPVTKPLNDNPAVTDRKGDNSAIAATGNPLQTFDRIPKKSRRRTDVTMTATNATDANNPIHITKAPQQVNPSLLRGFEAFNRGDLASAHAEYTHALQSDPQNTDALHGLAAIAQKQGQWDQAAWCYQKILEANPQDAVALAALINIRSQADPAIAESRLKTLVAAQPALAAPAFSLGNLYARQGRWNEAQQAYFQAHSADPDNPDILYNLAISLEHMRQSKLAIQYYSQAIAAAKTHPATFDSTQAATRMQALQP